MNAEPYVPVEYSIPLVLNGSLTAPGAPRKAKRITVAALSPLIPMRRDLAGAAALNFMRELWSAELNSVLPDKPDIIVLPEACDRYPAMLREERLAWYDFRGDSMLDFFREVAARQATHIVYSAARKMPGGTFRNSSRLIGREGEIIGVYDKNYPTVNEMDNWNIQAGRDIPVFETDFGRVAMTICFDLNFHELLERARSARPDLIAFSSMYHGGLMQQYWAYHCRSYFVSAVGCNCESTVVNPVGMFAVRSSNYLRGFTASINLDFELIHLSEYKKLQALKAHYGSGVTVTDPGYLGVVLLTSERSDVSAAEMIQKFSIETWEEYYARSAAHRLLPGKMAP